MQLGIFAKTFAGTQPRAVLGAAKAAGFSCVQYNLACSGLESMPEHVPDHVVTDVRDAVAETGVSLVALSATFNMIHPDVEVRANGLRQLDGIAAAAEAMGAPLVTLCTGSRNAQDMWRAHPGNDTHEAWRDLLASMERAVAIADRHEVDLGIEPELANVVNSAVKARRLTEEMKSPRIRIVFDPANLFETVGIDAQRRIVSDGLELLGDRIAICHAKDRLADGTFVAAGRGVLDYDHFIRELTKIGFDGPVVTHGLQAGEAAQVVAFLGRKVMQ